METHIHSDVTISECKLEEKCYSNYARTEGIAVYLNKSIAYSKVTTNVTNNFVRILSFETQIIYQRYCLVVFYHPPNKGDALFLNYFDEYLNVLAGFNGISVVLGDYNCDLVKDAFYTNK